MIKLTKENYLLLIEKASRAPSPHNIQPARWRFIEDQDGIVVELYECTTRWLRVGDPSGRDNQIALGAAWEGMVLALSELGLGFSDPKIEDPSPIPPDSVKYRKICSAQIVPGKLVDELAAYIFDRRSYRGCFPKADREHLEKLNLFSDETHCVNLISDRSSLGRIASLYDLAVAQGIRNPLFAKELYQWMRFSIQHPNWKRDGLSTNCMALSSAEAFAARFALKPSFVRILVFLGWESLLTSESVKVKSASAILLLHAPNNESPFDTGRNFYRIWLGLTREGFCGVPMSALPDSPEHAGQMLHDFPLPPDRRLVNVLRVGPMPKTPIPHSARLPVEELLLP